MGDFRHKMKYKVGDKVKIKTWKEMEKEYEPVEYGYIILSNNLGFLLEMEEKLKKLNTNRIVTIRDIDKNNNSYAIKELSFEWSDDMIEYLVKEKIF